MKRNRFIGSIGIAFHSLAPFAGMAITLRLIIEIFYAFNAMSVKWFDYPDTFGDKFTPWLIAAAAFLAHHKHTGLCAAVNLNAYRKAFGIISVSVPLAVLFAMFDVYMMNDFYNVITGSRFGEELALADLWGVELSTESLFSYEGAFLVLKLTLIYHSIFMAAYVAGHIMSSNSRMFWLFAADIVIFAIVFFAATITGSNSVSMLLIGVALILIIPLALSSLIPTLIFIGLSSSSIDSLAFYLTVAVGLWFISMCMDAVIIKNIKSEIKRIKLKR